MLLVTVITVLRSLEMVLDSLIFEKPWVMGLLDISMLDILYVTYIDRLR